MATLLLSAAGSAIGGAFGPAGALIGRAVGAVAGSVLDQAIIGALAPKQRIEGPRLTSVAITASTEGAAITRIVGRSRLAGQMIWATRFEEEIEKETSGGKGLGGPKTTTTTFSYFANFAVALCEGPVERIGRIWMDGRELDQLQATVRTYLGSEVQEADSLIVAKEGADNAPAYRGVAYIVFERLALEEYGNRMPLVTAEVFRAVGDLEPLVRAVALIPGSTEFGYDPQEITRKLGEGSFGPENRHTKVAASDLVASLDMLDDLAPNLELVNLVASWFGDDLRCGVCTIRPKVENATKETHKDGEEFPWVVAELARDQAEVMSQIDGRPAFGGAPNDRSLIAGIQHLKDRGYRVMMYPFIMMDIASDNTLPNPYSDNAATAGQPPYPWRGRITISPAAGFTGSPDKTASAATQVAAFLGTATAAHFATSSGTTITYTGPDEWSFRRFILHMAKIYGEPTVDDLSGAVEARRLSGAVASIRTLDVAPPVVMPESRARAVAEVLLHDAWAAREGLEFALPPSELALDAGDVVRVTAGITDTFRLTEFADGTARRARAAREDASITAVPALPRRTRPAGADTVIGQPVPVFFDGALLRDGDADWRGYIAAFLDPWPGGVAVYRSPTGSGFELDSILSAPAGMGTLAFDFFSGPVWRWDRGNELWVDLFSGTPTSASELAVLGGANAIAVENADGEWEVVQYVSAELNSPGRYKLTQLLRGQRGSEHARRNPVAAGARVLMLNTALGQPGIAESEVGLALTWRAGPANRDVADSSYVQQTVTLAGKGRRPLSPVHVAGRSPVGNDDIKLSWKRRTRIGGDGWDQTEVPLAEASESYEVEILDGAAVKRSFATSSPSLTYTAAQQTADFGAPIAFPDTLELRVYQLSAFFGRGTAEDATLFFPLPVEV